MLELERLFVTQLALGSPYDASPFEMLGHGVTVYTKLPSEHCY